MEVNAKLLAWKQLASFAKKESSAHLQKNQILIQLIQIRESESEEQSSIAVKYI
jgi:hypothetical protein